MKATVSFVVAVADNGVIGRGNDLPWHIPDDLKRFKALTLGKPCVMGRKTYESILARLGKPLPGRDSIVVSASGYAHEGAAAVCPDISSALEKAASSGADEIMVIGGAQIFAAALPLAGRIHLTEVHENPEGDAFFPPLDKALWRETAREDHGGHSFVTLERRT